MRNVLKVIFNLFFYVFFIWIQKEIIKLKQLIKGKIIQIYLEKFAKEYVICHDNTPIWKKYLSIFFYCSTSLTINWSYDIPRYSLNFFVLIISRLITKFLKPIIHEYRYLWDMNLFVLIFNWCFDDILVVFKCLLMFWYFFSRIGKSDFWGKFERKSISKNCKKGK